jgi:SAM dependent carboxyl methyltransferase
MSDAPRLHVSAMEGKGAYNRNAAIPASGGALAIPLLEKAAQQISLESGDRPIVIADYGSSQGKNSFAPMRAAIAGLRMRAGRQRPIFVCHTDLPANDFSEMFALLESDPESYLQNEPQVFPYAIGRSFYRNLFPPGHVDLGWSSYAAVWLSRIPVQIPDHFFIPCSTGAVRAEFDHQAARDWEAFLTLRAAELRGGGRLVVALPALDHDGTIGFASMMNHANAELFDLVAAGAITAEERARMTIAACPRREQDLLAPFAREGRFHGLVVEHSSTLSVPDPAWIEFQRDGDAAAFASKRAGFFRAVFVPSMSQALAPTRDTEERQIFADRLEEGVGRRIASNPASLENMVGMITLHKQASDQGTPADRRRIFVSPTL